MKIYIMTYHIYGFDLYNCNELGLNAAAYFVLYIASYICCTTGLKINIAILKSLLFLNMWLHIVAIMLLTTVEYVII